MIEHTYTSKSGGQYLVVEECWPEWVSPPTIRY